MGNGIAAAMAKIDKAFGNGSIQRLGEGTVAPVESISSGSIALDQALGIGGFPRGRIVEVYGPESSGKSTLALQAVANAQKYGTAVYIDTEHAIDIGYAASLGVDTDSLLLAQPDTAEQAFEIIETLVDSGEVSIVVLDSVAALASRRELEGDYGDSNVGVIARLMSQAMRKLVGKVADTNTLLMCINQIRMKVGVVYGSPETTTGGLALKYYSSVRLDIRRKEVQRADGEATGNRTKVKVVKNKMAPPLKECEFDIVYGEGIDLAGEIIDLGITTGVLTKGGAWIKYGDKQWQGRPKAIAALKSEPDLLNQLDKLVRSALN